MSFNPVRRTFGRPKVLALLVAAFMLAGFGVATPLANAPTAAAAAPTAAAAPAIAPAAAAPPIALAAIPATGAIPVQPCPGTTSSSYGNINTPAGFNFAEGSWGEQMLRDGKTVMLYGNQGAVYVDSTGNNTSEGQGGLPYCGARVLDNGDLEVDWRFCTDQDKRGCAHNSPGSEWTGTPERVLSDEQKLQIANVLLGASLTTKRERAVTQLQVWCISNDWAEGAVNTEAKTYFNYNDFQGPLTSGDAEYRALSDDEARCNYLPTLVATPTLGLSVPTNTVSVGSPAEFTVSSNVTSPIEITTTGASSVQLCPAEQAGVTFDGSHLRFSTPGSAMLCVYATSTSNVTLTADTGELPYAATLNLLWNGDVGCQVFADYVQALGIRLQSQLNVNFIGSGTFEVAKDFVGVAPGQGDLDDVSVELSYEVVSGPALPAGTPSSGRLLLNQANGFSATGPTYPDGTVVRIEEVGITGLPPALEQNGMTWSVDGQSSTGSSVDITVGDGTTVAVTLTNTLGAVLGTFEVRKQFAFDAGEPAQPVTVDVEVLWWVQGSDPSTAQTITLTAANGYAALPGTDPSSPDLFPIGTTILLEEVAPVLPPGITHVIDWGSNTDPTYTGPANRGRVTISEVWDASNHTQGGNTSAAEVELTNGIAIDRGSLKIRKEIKDADGNAQSPGAIGGSFDDMEVVVEVSWQHPDPLITATGSNTLILNAANGWEAGLGVDLPHGTEVTSEEVAIYSVDPSIEWDATPSWSCGNCNPPATDVPGAVHTVTVVGAQAGDPIADLALVLTNTYRVMAGSFSVEKIVAGGIDRDDDRPTGAVFTARWDSTDPAQPTGELALQAPSWTAVPVDGAGAPLTFPLGTEITLSEVGLPVIPGVVWDSDVAWSIGDGGTDASFTIVDEDAGAVPAATVTLTNFAELHEGRFSIAKFVHSVAPVDSSGASFTVHYRSPGENPQYSGTLTVVNEEEVVSDVFPAGTELLLEEIVPEALPGTEGWAAPQFVDSTGQVLASPVLITVGDGADTRIQLVNTTVEPDEPEPNEPERPDLPRTGSEFDTPLWTGAAASLILFGVALSVLAVRRRRARL